MTNEQVAATDLLSLAVDVVRTAGGQVMRMRADAVSRDVGTKSTDTDVVTEADRAVERQIVSALRRARPHDEVLGEEHGTAPTPDGPPSPVRWILDPIDGTVNYLYGLPWYAVSLAAQLDGQVVAGVVHQPVTGQMWTAVAGQGAWRDGQPLRCSAEDTLGRALVATGFAYGAAQRAHQARVVDALLPQVRDIRRLGAAALDLCVAAEGAVDAYYETGLSPWDHAAGGLIAAEAGLRVEGLQRAPAGEQMLIAAPPALFDALHDRLVALDAAGGPGGP